MTDIEKLISMLQSPKSSTRYEACEYLRVAPALTPEAIIALQNAINDPDASVAEAAQRALAIQLPLERSREAPSQPTSWLERLWQIGFPINVVITVLSFPVGFFLTIFIAMAMRGCEQFYGPADILANFVMIFPFVSVIALGFSYFFRKRHKITTATILAFVPVTGNLLYVVFNLLLPEGCAYLW